MKRKVLFNRTLNIGTMSASSLRLVLFCSLFTILGIIFSLGHAVDGHEWPASEVDDDVVYYEQLFTHNFDVLRARANQFAHSVAVPSFDRATRALNISAVCRKALRTMLGHPDREWAALMLDASGRLTRPGFLSGTITDFGDYDQCMSVAGHTDLSLSSQAGALTARYCLLSARPPIPPPSVDLNFSRTNYARSWAARRFGNPNYRFYHRIVSALCFPSMCKAYEVERVARKMLADFNLDIAVEACQVAGEPQPLDSAQTLALFILAFCAFAVVVGTCLELRDDRLARRKAWLQRQQQQPKHPNSGRPLHLPRPPRNLEKESRKVAGSFWRCFSIIRNTRTLLSIHEPRTGDLSPIHGLRVLLIGWVIVCHTTNFAPLGLFDQPMIASRFAQSINITRDLVTQFVISGSLSVQSFFIISGLISLHTALVDKDYFRRSVSYPKYVFLRWFRFAPPLLGMFCYMYLWPRLVSGPMAHWHYLGINQQPCYDRWWHNFLFYNNWDTLLEMCASHTWFLSADFQINLFVYFLVATYVRNYRLGLRLNQVALAVAAVAPTLVNWYYRVALVHILEPDMDKLNYNFNMIEFNTYNHFAAYLAGVLVAAYLHQRPKPPAPASAATTRSLVWLSLVVLLLVPFSTYPFIHMSSIPTTILPILYTGIKRAAWIAALSWIIYASCTVSRRALLGQVLSARMWQPLSRLTFSVYLVQSLAVWMYAYNLRDTVSISHMNTFYRIGGNWLYAIFFGFWLHVLFEAPSVNLLKLTIKRRPRQPKEMHDVNNNNVVVGRTKIVEEEKGDEHSTEDNNLIEREEGKE